MGEPARIRTGVRNELRCPTRCLVGYELALLEREPEVLPLSGPCHPHRRRVDAEDPARGPMPATLVNTRLRPATSPSSGPRLRPGIVLLPDAETGRGRVLKDPRKRKYYRFDELEGFILERLDGERSAVDIQIDAATMLGEELSLDEIQEFLDSLREKGLIEDGQPCLPVLSPALGQEVYRALEQGGFRFRRADEPLPSGMPPTRRNPAEARQFDEAVELLRAGRFQAALRAFEEILAANPANQRAAAIRALLVQAGSAKVRSLLEGPAKERNNPLYWRLPLFDPDRLFSALEPGLRFVWTRSFGFIYFALVAFAGWLALAHRSEILERLPQLSAAGWAAGLLVAAIALTALHEFAHGLTCKHYGGKVPELGFLLIFFVMPALYVDVSDAWLFPRRAQRALVSLAGPLFDLAAASVALIVWWIVPPGPLHTACVMSMTASMASVLMNLNPLMRLDGYYILSDLAGIPNLRSAAYGAMGRIFRSQTHTGISLTPRARAFLGIYGVLSVAYILSVLYLMLGFVIGVSTSLAGLWGPVLLAGLLAYLLRNPLSLLTRMLLNRARETSVRGALTLVASAATLALIAVIPWPLKVSGPAHVAARTQIAVRPEITGNLTEILVRQGDTVAAGQVVARFERSELSTRLAMTRSEIERARAELELLLRGPEREHLQRARERVRAAQAEATQLRSRFDRLSRLKDEGLVATDLYEQVGKDLAVSEGGLRAAQDETRLLRRGARPEKIKAARASVARLETQAADVLRRLAACDLRAPITGVVVTPQLEERTGERVTSGEALMEIADTGDLVSDVLVLEAEIGDVAAGQAIDLRFAAYPDRIFKGQVLEIAPIAEKDRLSRATFMVRCSIEDEAGKLRPGMTGAAKISCGSLPIGRLALRRVLRLIDPALF